MPVDFRVVLIVVLMFGLVLGSFATALIHRIPLGLPWALPPRKNSGAIPRSACPHCGYVLQPLDLVPVFSWLALGGRCRRCRAPIGILYPAVEIGTAFGCLAAALAFGIAPDGIAVMLALPLLAALFVIDLRHRLLPDSLNLMLIGLGLIRIAGQGVYLHDSATAIGTLLVTAILAMAVYASVSWLIGATMRRILQKDALGLGDVKFFGVAGLWLGLGLLPTFMIFSGVLGIGIGLIYQMILKQRYFPFGPALILTFSILLLSTGPRLATMHLYFPFAFLG
jgi:leader peptidase (prepilin peptidase)/N-methyltransferase